MRLLVLGGTRHVGRAAVEVALARGDEVTTVNRGVSRPDPDGVRAVRADRSVPGSLAAALGPVDTWDAVLDTWSGAPRVVRESARLLVGRVGHYGYVSSRSAYRWPFPPSGDESAPLVVGDAGAGDEVAYPEAKRGAELAVLESFGDASLLARAGLVLGPYEMVGRLPWWLGRLSEGGRVVAPGPPERPLQYIDGRDLAAWMLRCAGNGTVGAYNAVSRPGHATMATLLEAGRTVTGGSAELVWVSPEVVEAAGVQPWTELPIWLPPTGEYAGMHDGDVSAAVAAGLVCRPVEDTVADTWAWLLAEGYPPPAEGRPPVGLDPEREREVLGSAS